MNVCIGRIPEEQSVVFPRSFCPQCKYNIPWYCNIPIISYLILLGKCKNCAKKIPIRYLVVEIITPLLFLLVPWKMGDWHLWPFYIFFMSSLIIATFVDLENWIIPDVVTLPGILIGFGSSFLNPAVSWMDSLVGILLGGGILLAIGTFYEKVKKIEGIGGGDVKFLAMGGAFLGISGVVTTLILSSVVGTIIGGAVMLATGKDSKMAIPFGPFLSLGLLISYLYGAEMWAWYLDQSQASYGMMGR